MIVNLINDSTSEIRITDLHGFTIDPQESRNVIDFYPFHRVEQSQDLRDYITNSDIIVNNGTSDLSIVNGLKHLNHLTEFESRHNLISELHNDMPSPTGNYPHEILSYDGTAYTWVEHIGGSGESIISGINFTMSDHASHDYVGNGAITWTSIRTFVYDGTTIWTPNKFSVIGSMSKLGATGYARLFDYTNNNEIALISWTDVLKQTYTDSILVNLPTNQAILELQTRTGSNGTDVRTHYMALY